MNKNIVQRMVEEKIVKIGSDITASYGDKTKIFSGVEFSLVETEKGIIFTRKTKLLTSNNRIDYKLESKKISEGIHLYKVIQLSIYIYEKETFVQIYNGVIDDNVRVIVTDKDGINKKYYEPEINRSLLEISSFEEMQKTFQYFIEFANFVIGNYCFSGEEIKFAKFLFKDRHISNTVGKNAITEENNMPIIEALNTSDYTDTRTSNRCITLVKSNNGNVLICDLEESKNPIYSDMMYIKFHFVDFNEKNTMAYPLLNKISAYINNKEVISLYVDTTFKGKELNFSISAKHINNNIYKDICLNYFNNEIESFFLDTTYDLATLYNKLSLAYMAENY